MKAPSSDFEQFLLEVNGLHFEAIALGPAQGELALFLHGFPQFADAWAPIMRAVAAAGYRAVAVNQRGYSPRARPVGVEDYAVAKLVSDALGFADALGSRSFHLIGHDFGGYVAWKLAAENAGRLISLSVLSMPHTNAFLDALESDEDQKRRSVYISLFRAPDHVAEGAMLAANADRLRSAYRGKVPEALVNENVRRFLEPQALTSALNWYRALNLEARIKIVAVPTLFVWGSEDHALGEAAARNTAAFISHSYRFEILDGKSHWLLEEAPDLCAPLLLQHFTSAKLATSAV